MKMRVLEVRAARAERIEIELAAETPADGDEKEERRST
jgi:hypothetical protein